jgi:muconolactone delta-isomerase
MTPGERKALGVYRADGKEQLDSLRSALPLHECMSVAITPLEPHPSDPS